MKMLLKSTPPIAKPMIGLRMSFTKLPTMALKATPIMMPMARSTTLPRNDESTKFRDPS